MSNIVTLFELNNKVRCGINELFPDTFWITGEICELNVNQSGHCYLELIEKKADSDQIIARAKANIWAFTFRMLRPYFESVTGQRFCKGIKIMVKVTVEFHEAYGFSLNIKDIEPHFTLGDISRKKREIVQRLTDEGVFHLNKETEFPMVPQRLAVISSETAAGYGDFMDQLQKNNGGYAFKVQLFQSLMQGNEAEQSIIQALERIFERIDDFDAVVIIRGGGSQADLDCFNSYWLCYHITQFPIPVLTGIGHERDESIADMVAHTNLKTPTAVAEFILDKVSAFDDYLNELHEKVMGNVTETLTDWKEENERFTRTVVSLVNLRMNAENQKLHAFEAIGEKLVKSYLQNKNQQLRVVREKIHSGLRHYFQKNNLQLMMIHKNLQILLRNFLKEEKNKLDRFESVNNLLDPVHVMKRGYSLIFSKGMLIKSIDQLKPGDLLESKLIDGSVTSTVNEIRPPNPEE